MITLEVCAHLFAQYRLAPDQLDAMFGIQFTKGQQGASDWCGWGVVAPHSIQRDSRQGQPSRAATRCLPA
jgi:hypothetical protein